VTPLAHGKVITAEGAFAIMTGHAALSFAGGMMIGRLRRCYLTPLRHAGFNLMTIVATQLLFCSVSCMAEVHPKSCGPCRRPSVTTELVARTAGRNIPVTGLRARCMTTVTGGVRVKTPGNGKRDSAPRRTMTRCTTYTAHIQVSGMIKVYAKTL
jgi:hypothetical protein